jgi:hypothetical protein
MKFLTAGPTPHTHKAKETDQWALAVGASGCQIWAVHTMWVEQAESAHAHISYFSFSFSIIIIIIIIIKIQI